MLLTERKETIQGLLLRLIELCPDRITKGTFNGFELKVIGKLVCLSDDATNPIDQGLIIVAVQEEVKRREWFLNFNIDCNHYYSCRVEHPEGEVLTTDENPTIAYLLALIKAIEL